MVRSSERDSVSEDSFPDFSAIYDAYHERVLAYVARLIGRDQAADVAQEVFLKIARSLNTHVDPTRLTPWVYAIALNTVRDTVRRRASRIDSATCGGEGADRLSSVADSRAATPEEVVVRNEMVGCYLEYVKQLPRDYYEVYVLSELEDLSNAEIARRLALPLSTVKIRLHRARARLYDALRRDCQSYYNERGELMGEPKPRDDG